MNSLTHIVAPEEIMALLDGELTRAEAEVVSAHIEGCAECAAVRDELRGTSDALRAWAVPAVGSAMERAVAERVAAKAGNAGPPRRVTPLTIRNWRLWAIGSGGAVAAVLAYVIFAVSMISYEDRYETRRSMAMMSVAPDENKAVDKSVGTFGYADAAHPSPQQSDLTRIDIPLPATSVANLAKLQPGIAGGTVPSPPAAAAPMIARTVAMTVLVKNVAESRAALDGILAQHHGYAAQLTVNTPENGSRSFQSSLRIPAGDLTAALDALRKLGRVQTETQSGEEVTQQHTDLVARLTNACETETRLRAILQQRTGKMQDVLDVEEKISETRGEIEQMEAEQKELEHRVDFASIDLQLTEEYKAQLGGTSPSVGNEMSSAFVAGLRHAGASLLGMVLFVEEYGPVLLIWAAILGVPAVLVWRRFGRKQDGVH